jgi:hypothetical protein
MASNGNSVHNYSATIVSPPMQSSSGRSWLVFWYSLRHGSLRVTTSSSTSIYTNVQTVWNATGNEDHFWKPVSVTLYNTSESFIVRIKIKVI